MSCVSAAHLVFTELKVSGKRPGSQRPLQSKAERGTYQRVDIMLLSIAYYVPALVPVAQW